MARAEKVAAVAELTERFQSSTGAVLTEYRGLSVAQLGELRHVARRARHVLGGEEHADQDRRDRGWRRKLTSPRCSRARRRSRSCRAMWSRPPKGLRDFAKTNPFLVIKGGVLDGKMLKPAEIVQAR